VTQHLAYRTIYGEAWCGDSLDLLRALPDASVNLVITSPPFEFAALVRDKLKSDCSFVLDLGGAYQKGVPSRSLYNFRVPIRFCDDLGFFLAEDFYWYNPSKLPSPIEWVNKRKIRVKDAVNNVWWFSKTAWPKADVSKVLTPYSDRMKKLIEDPAAFYTPKSRPSGHDIGSGFGRDNGGAIPSNLLQIPNTDSNGGYLRGCKVVGAKGHPARFPAKLPEFFIKFLTEPGDLVVDIFAGSNTTGRVAEDLGRRWRAFEMSPEYIAASAFRFLDKDASASRLQDVHSAIKGGKTLDLRAESGLLQLAAE
jgi:DNA modification methylase